MAKPTTRPTVSLTHRLAVWTLGIAGGTGRSATAGLLAAALTERLEVINGSGPVVLLDGTSAATSPWPGWLHAPLDTARQRPNSHVPGAHPFDGFNVGEWPVRTVEPGLGLRVAIDVGGQLAPASMPAALRDVAAGRLPAVLATARAYVIDGPAGQLDGLWWAAHRDPDSVAEQLIPHLLAARPPVDVAQGDLAVAVLHVRADLAGLSSALTLVTCLGLLGIGCDRMMVCAAIPTQGMSRPAKVRAELLRGHVADVVLLPYLADVAKLGAPAYTDPGLRQRAGGLIDAVLTVAATADTAGKVTREQAGPGDRGSTAPVTQTQARITLPNPEDSLPEKPRPPIRVVSDDPYAALQGVTGGQP